jgi:dTDP-4-dehydrorhamnose 3,5-epimerase
MLKGIEVKVLNRFADERGFFTELMRSDWDDIIEEEIIRGRGTDI